MFHHLASVISIFWEMFSKFTMLLTCSVVWVHCPYHLCWNHGPWRSKAEERRRQGARVFLLEIFISHGRFLWGVSRRALLVVESWNLVKIISYVSELPQILSRLFYFAWRLSELLYCRRRRMMAQNIAWCVPFDTPNLLQVTGNLSKLFPCLVFLFWSSAKIALHGTITAVYWWLT